MVRAAPYCNVDEDDNAAAVNSMICILVIAIHKYYQ